MTKEAAVDRKSSWIGVDLDGTLAQDLGEPHGYAIGPPIPEMVERVKAWLAEGIEVRIFTARVSKEEERSYQMLTIQHWCGEHIGRELKVTCIKDFNMWELWDDRAVQVVKNTGQRVGDELR